MTRLEAIARQQNPNIKARLERMTDAEYVSHRAQLDASIGSGAVAASAKRMAAELMNKVR